VNCPPCNRNCQQGDTCPARFDTLRDRMQQPDTRGYSVWAAIAGAITVIVVVTILYVINVKGNS
jgi:hypothetical protein